MGSKKQNGLLQDQSLQLVPKIKAEDNPWYLLATLYGVPEHQDKKLQDKNRTAWNRYVAASLDEEIRTKLIEGKRLPVEQLTAFSPEELREVATAFGERWRASREGFTPLKLPASGAALIDFSNVEFDRHVFFNGYVFSDAYFYSAAFSGDAYFDRATFSGRTNFYSATFSGYASFRGAAFSGEANFFGATVLAPAIFDRATFSGRTNFTGATFDWAIFDGTVFSGTVSFSKATNGEEIRFTTFGGRTSFINVKMKEPTSFEGAIFKTEPPRFFGAKLHQGTVWRSIRKWPAPKKADEAGAFIDAYACLKLEMDRLKKHEDELNFFALELQSRRVQLGPWRGLPFALYGLLSNYGRSYLRPLVAIFVVSLIGAGAFCYFDARSFGEALTLSAASTLNVFGFRRDFGLEICTPLAWLKVFSALQTILGAILLFLFGLGIRNKFRMK